MYCFAYSGFFSKQNNKDSHPYDTYVQMGYIDNVCNKEVHYVAGKRVASAMGEEKAKMLDVGWSCVQY